MIEADDGLPLLSDTYFLGSSIVQPVAVTTPAALLRSRSPAIDDRLPPRHVAVIGCEADDTLLRRIIAQFGCDVPSLQSLPCPPGIAVAAIIGDKGEGSDEGTLRLCAEWAGSCPVLLVSSQTSLDFRLAAAKAGVTALVQQPINAVEISEWLSDFVGRTLEERGSVLIVDDDRIAASITGEILRSAGMSVSMIHDPAQVLQHLEHALPDLILMDVQMPGIDGIRLTQVIRQARRFVSMPVLFLSGERDETRQFAARQIGGDDFIERPIAPQRLIDIVRMRIDRSKVLRDLIERDRLTGLYNQTSFKERLSFELERCHRTGTEMSFVVIDIDHFKTVNDTHGHAAGDMVLRALADTLLSGLRRIDIVGRLGGEEFGILFLSTTEKPAAMVVDRLRREFQGQEFDAPGGAFHVTFSAGLACSQSFSGDLRTMIAAADNALYDAKRGGRNTLCIALPSDPGVKAA